MRIIGPVTKIEHRHCDTCERKRECVFHSVDADYKKATITLWSCWTCYRNMVRHAIEFSKIPF